MTSENARRLENLICVSFLSDSVPQEDQIRHTAEHLRSLAPVDEEEFQEVLRRVHARLLIGMDTGAAISEPYQPWLSARKPEIEPYFWNRFSQLLLQQRWPIQVVTTLDKVTDEVLDLTGNPVQVGKWRRRGLVVGDVQSGKTATYTALTCKAADAGYRLVILLTGTLENLRRQTQERLDAGFVGLDSSGLLARERSRREVGVGEIDRQRMAIVFTSKTSDFNTKLVNQLNLRIQEAKEPILLVVKKNTRILENLTRWLANYNAGANGIIDAPMLLIDDEADNASINTNPGNRNPTAVNDAIRSLLDLFTRASYVGFTATPFANIFIDPDLDEEMEKQDLFPRDFIYALQPPTNYVGAKAIFGADEESPCLRLIEDAENIFLARQRRAYPVDDLPDSLREALRTFILTNVLRDLRQEGATHRSMLVNVSQFTDVQNAVAQLLEQELRQVQQDIRNYSRLPEEQALRNPALAALHRTWSREFSDKGPDWPAVQAELLGSALPIEVRAVNQKSVRGGLDFAAHRQSGLRVVAVGGNSLSRGLTLEGLCTSYFYRNTQMYDTLLQMGRWFGYRDGYEDLCRIWLADEAISWYAHITAASEELRSLIQDMSKLGRTPKEFGLKVRAHPESLLITAKNKMRSAHEIERVISISEQGPETSQLLLGQDHIRANMLAAQRFIRGLAEAGIGQNVSPWGNIAWYSVPKQHISRLLRDFVGHPLDIFFQHDFLARFLDDSNEKCLETWDVVVPQGKAETVEFAGLQFRPQDRQVTINQASRSIFVSGRSRRVGSRGIEREGLTREDAERINTEYRQNHNGANTPDKEYRKHRSRPLLLLHLMQPSNPDLQLDPDDRLVALGMSFPKFRDDAQYQRVRYRINLVELQNMLSIEDGDDQEADDDEL
jgi:hypothetical protein